jgi:hypothetical protein
VEGVDASIRDRNNCSDLNVSLVVDDHNGSTRLITSQKLYLSKIAQPELFVHADDLQDYVKVCV